LLYANAGFKLKAMLMDVNSKRTRISPNEIQNYLNVVSKGEHVPEIEDTTNRQRTHDARTAPLPRSQHLSSSH
jgi:hypothetical protein